MKPRHFAIFMACFLFVYSFVRPDGIDWVGRIVSTLAGAGVAYVVYALLRHWFPNMK